MTYREIFAEIYRDHKIGIKIYVIFSAVLSLLIATSGNLVLAAETAGVATTIGVLGGTFGQVFGPVAESSLASLDVSAAMALSSIVSILVEYVPQSFFDTIHLSAAKSYSFGLLEFWPVRIFTFVWFLISWLSRSSFISESTGVVLENIESIVGGIVNIVVVVSQVLSNTGVGTTVEAATVASHSASKAGGIGVVSTVITFVLVFFILIVCAVTYFFVRIFCFYVDVLLVPLCSSVPFSALLINIVKFNGILILGLIALYAPYIFLVIYAGIVVLAIIFFKKAYTGLRYFSNIYTKPLFRRMRGYDEAIPLTAEKLPKNLLKKEDLSMANIVIPVYLGRKLSKIALRHQKWYFIVTPTRQYLCKPRGGKKENYYLELTNSDEKKLFIKKSVRFFEVFNLLNGEENIGKPFRRIKKDVHFVYSKEYFFRYDLMKEITGYTDFTIYQQEMSEKYKSSKKALREQKRLARLEAREERKIARRAKRTSAQV